MGRKSKSNELTDKGLKKVQVTSLLGKQQTLDALADCLARMVVARASNHRGVSPMDKEQDNVTNE